MRPVFKRTDTFVLLALSLLAFAVASFSYGQGRILGEHVAFARGVHDGTQIVPHPGIFLLASAWSTLSGQGIGPALSQILALHFVAAFVAAYWCLNQFLSTSGNSYVRMALALGLLLASPIGLPFISPWVYNFGYNSRMPFGLHNATHIGLLPYMYLAFGMLCRIIKQTQHQHEPSNPLLVAFSGILICSTLIKPSFSIALIPAIAIYFLFSGKQNDRQVLKLFLALLPSGLMILIQYYVGFIHNPLGKTIEYSLAPFQVWEGNNKLPLLSFLLACAFPLWVTWHRYKQLTAPTYIAWASLLIALVPYILLAETKEYGDRNFEWSYLHSRMILFLCCAGELVLWLRPALQNNKAHPALSGAQAIACILFILHCAFGYFRFIIYLSPNLFKTGGLF